MSANIYSHFVTFLWLHTEMAFQFKICCKRFSSNNLTFLSGDSTTVCHFFSAHVQKRHFPAGLIYITFTFTYAVFVAVNCNWQIQCLPN